MTNTVLGLLRHGQTDWNIDLRLQGTTDIPMNEAGVAQISLAARSLPGDWDVILSSPLGRAKHSAQIVAEALGHGEVIEEPLLLERSFGVGEGMTYEQWQQHYAQLEDIPGADSKLVMKERSLRLLEEIQIRYAGSRVLAVSHGALIRFVLNEVSQGKIPPAGERLQNASLHIFRHSGAWSVDGWAPESLGSELPGDYK
ncbi:MAG: hypothetical protein RL696_832 [Actinomycetota bacterium]|jgi:broad specificity phosphatase PhoE